MGRVFNPLSRTIAAGCLILLAVAIAAGATVHVQTDLVRVVGKYFRLEDTAWDDLRIVPSAFDFAGSSDPALVNWRPGGSGTTFKAWEFDNADQAFFLVQLPHNRKPGTDLKVHVHWTPQTRGNEENAKTVFWKIDISAASIGGTFPASSVYDMSDACDGVDDAHQMTPDITVTGSTLGVSAMLQCRIFRDAGDSWATNTTGNLPLLLEVDFHYEIDRLGSDNYNGND